jgi:hypothetical protein
MIRDCTPQGVLEVIGPYIRGYLRRDARFRDRLGMFVSSTSDSILFDADVVGGVGYNGLKRLPRCGPPCARFWAMFSQPSTYDAVEKLCFEVLALLPQESIVSFQTDLSVTGETVVTMPNLETLYLLHPVVSDGFLLPDPNGPNADKKLLPSLRLLYLKNVRAEDDNWDPLVTYLTHQTSGGQAVSLEILGDGIHICSKVIKQIEGLVDEFSYKPDPDRNSSFGECL